jgi:hypothetical protein
MPEDTGRQSLDHGLIYKYFRVSYAILPWRRGISNRGPLDSIRMASIRSNPQETRSTLVIARSKINGPQLPASLIKPSPTIRDLRLTFVSTEAVWLT